MLLRRRDARRRRARAFDGQDASWSPAPATWRSTRPRRPSSWARRSWPCPIPTATSCDEAGIDLAAGEGRSRRCAVDAISDYAGRAPRRRVSRWLTAPSGSVPCDIALPCATQNELTLTGVQSADARTASSWWPRARTCPPPPRRSRLCRRRACAYAPGKASNAGGVATSGSGDAAELRRAQLDASRRVDAKLHQIMVDIHANTVASRRGIRCGWRLRGRREPGGFPQGGRRDGCDGSHLIRFLWVPRRRIGVGAPSYLPLAGE